MKRPRILKLSYLYSDSPTQFIHRRAEPRNAVLKLFISTGFYFALFVFVIVVHIWPRG